MKSLYKDIDSINNKEYEIYKVNAIELSKTLKENYNLLKKDYKTYVNITSEDGENIKEIYEYLNFSLLRLEDGTLVLLDGFRRLLSYQPPNININVRVYNKKDFSTTELLKLLINYNQFKLIGNSGGSYFERGFYFLIDVLYDIQLQNIEKSMIGYLEKELKADYWNSSHITINNGVKYKTVPERLINDKFLMDMKVIKDTNINFKNSGFFGAILFDLRNSGFEGIFDSNLIETSINSSDAIKKQEKIINTYGKNDYRGEKALNEVFTLYKNIISGTIGLERVKTYGEKLVECDELVTNLKADKNYLKISGTSKYREITNFMMNHDLSKVKTKVIIFPNSGSQRPHGLFEDVNLVIDKKKRHLASDIDYLFVGVNYNGKTYNLGCSGYNSYYSSYKKHYTNIRLDFDEKFGLGNEQKVEVFISVEGYSRSALQKEFK